MFDSQTDERDVQTEIQIYQVLASTQGVTCKHHLPVELEAVCSDTDIHYIPFRLPSMRKKPPSGFQNEQNGRESNLFQTSRHFDTDKITSTKESSKESPVIHLRQRRDENLISFKRYTWLYKKKYYDKLLLYDSVLLKQRKEKSIWSGIFSVLKNAILEETKYYSRFLPMPRHWYFLYDSKIRCPLRRNLKEILRLKKEKIREDRLQIMLQPHVFASSQKSYGNDEQMETLVSGSFGDINEVFEFKSKEGFNQGLSVAEKKAMSYEEQAIQYRRMRVVRNAKRIIKSVIRAWQVEAKIYLRRDFWTFSHYQNDFYTNVLTFDGHTLPHPCQDMRCQTTPSLMDTEKYEGPRQQTTIWKGFFSTEGNKNKITDDNALAPVKYRKLLLPYITKPIVKL